MHCVITFYVLCLRMDLNQKNKIMNFKELQKEIEKNANQGMYTQLFAESDNSIKDLITYILSTREEQEIVKNIRILINQSAFPFIETIMNGLLFQLDDADIKIIIDDRCKNIENMLKEFGELHIDSKNIKINNTDVFIRFAIIVDDNDYIVQYSSNSDRFKVQANLNCYKKCTYIYKWIKQFDEMFDKLKPLEDKDKIWFKKCLPELNHEDIQAEFDREIIKEIINTNKQLKNKITLD